MNEGAKLQREELHLHELGIAALSALFVNANRDPKKGQPVKPSDFFNFKQDEDLPKIASVCCDTFFSLVADQKLPQWALVLAPTESLLADRRQGVVRGGLREDFSHNTSSLPRAFMRKGVLLVAPSITNNTVKAGLAIIDQVEGKVSVIDVDIGTVHTIFVPNKQRGSYWLIDAEFYLEEKYK